MRRRRLLCATALALGLSGGCARSKETTGSLTARHRAGVERAWRKAVAQCFGEADAGRGASAPSPAQDTGLERSAEVVDVTAACFDALKDGLQNGRIAFASLRGKTEAWAEPPGFGVGHWQLATDPEGSGYVATRTDAGPQRVHLHREADGPDGRWLRLDVFLEAAPPPALRSPR
jgi:hypothetical protein